MQVSPLLAIVVLSSFPVPAAADDEDRPEPGAAGAAAVGAAVLPAAAGDEDRPEPGAAGAVGAAVQENRPAPPPPAPVTAISDRRVRLDLGFAHWYGDRFRSNSKRGGGGLDTGQLTSTSVGAGFRPFLRWLELRLRYDRTRLQTGAGDPFASSYDSRRAEFLSAQLALTRTLQLGNELLTVGYGGGAVLVRIAGHPQTVGQTFGFNVEYFFGPSLLGAKLGAFIDGREQGYALELPDGSQSDQIDFNLAVGFALALFN